MRALPHLLLTRLPLPRLLPLRLSLARLLLLAALCFAPLAAGADPARVVVFGDSLTRGFGLAPGRGFVPALSRWLKAERSSGSDSRPFTGSANATMRAWSLVVRSTARVPRPNTSRSMPASASTVASHV